MLFQVMHGNVIFKRSHLVALSGINDNTLKTYLHFLHGKPGKKTEERRATLYTCADAMTIILMAELKSELDIRPDRSFDLAQWASDNFIRRWDLIQKNKAVPGFPKSTWSLAFNISDGPRGIASFLPAEFDSKLDRCEALRPSYQLASVMFSDQRTYDIAFAPVVDLYEVLTGVNLILDLIKEPCRDDTRHE